MKKTILPFMAILTTPAIIMTQSNCASPYKDDTDQFVCVSNYCDRTGKEDCADIIQKIIDQNPNRTIYFRDGTYLLSHPIKINADANKAVGLKLSNFAILKATDDFKVKRDESYVKQDWEDDYNYMVQIGVDRANTLLTKNTFSGGIIDGNGKACGLEITGGREAQVHDVQIRNTEIGLKVAKGVNGADSADANIHDVSILCNNSNTSVGFWSDCSDSEYTNIRVTSAHTGVKQTRAGHNFYTNVHVLCGGMSTEDYNTSVGFNSTAINWYTNCYSDCYHTAFLSSGKIYGINCTAWFHTTASSEPDVALYSTVNMNSIFYNFVCGFNKHEDETVKNTVLKLGDGKSIKDGKIHNIIIGHRDTLDDNDLYKQCHEGIDTDY